MEKHIDVLGYLLAAIVFSVGFLAARVHASYDSTEREVREQSWRVRNALLHGDPIGPAELADTIAVTRYTTDRVASLSRLVNYGLFLATVVVYIAAMLLLSEGATGPPEAVLITTLVFLGSASVIIIGELDVRKVDRDRRVIIADSLVGAISGLAETLAAKRLEEFGDRLAALAEMYPDWGLLTELHAYKNLLEGHPGKGLRQITELADTRTYLYLTPVVGTACALADGDSAAGLRLLDELAARKETTRDLISLRAALRLSRAHIEVMAQHHELIDRSGDLAGLAASGPYGVARETRSGPTRSGLADRFTALDLRPDQITQTLALLDLSHAWLRGPDVAEVHRLSAGGPLAAALRLVLPSSADDPGPAVSDLLRIKDSETLETFGLIFLAQGRIRDALRMIERSIRTTPGNYRTHWAMAVICHRLGWRTAAEASLQKMDTLRPETPLLQITRLAFAQPSQIPDSGHLDDFFFGGYSTVECLQVALLGVEPGKPMGTETVRECFFTRLNASARTVLGHRPVPTGVRR